MPNNENLPQIMMLVGPNNAGKGTQATLLKENFPDRYHLDFGAELRSFVNRNICNINQTGELVNPTTGPSDIKVAHSLREEMNNSRPVDNEDLKYVVESAIINSIRKQQGMIVDGAGRTVPEANWLSGFLNENNVDTSIFHIHISLEEALRRASNRWLVNGKPYSSKETALAACQNGEEPVQRADDADPEKVAQRYTEMYSRDFAKIISIYQLVAKAELFTLDGRKPVIEVSNDISEYLRRFRGWEA